MTAPSIVQAYPLDGAVGVTLADSFYIIFDKEVDMSTVKILMEGPAAAWFGGPGLVMWDDPLFMDDDDVLSQHGYNAKVPGTLVFQKVDNDGNVMSGAWDFSGGGSAWRTKVIFTPTNPLAPSTQYIVYVFGDEDDGDSIASGVSTRTVFDAVKGANVGDGDVYFDGGYTGSTQDIYHIQLQETGDAGDGLKFHWWREGATLHRVLQTKMQSQLLDQGVTVRFYGDFVVGDTFTVVVRPAERMQSTYRWSFTTGSGSIVSLPSTVVGDPSVPIASTSMTTSSGTGFRVLGITPANRSTNMSADDLSVITIKFSADIDPATITDSTVTVWTEPVNGDPSIAATSVLAKVLSVDGDTLTITIGS